MKTETIFRLETDDGHYDYSNPDDAKQEYLNIVNCPDRETVYNTSWVRISQLDITILDEWTIKDSV